MIQPGVRYRGVTSHACGTMAKAVQGAVYCLRAPATRPAARRGQWSRLEIVVAAILGALLLLLFGWLWLSDRHEQTARGNFGSANVIVAPPDNLQPNG